MRTPMRVVERPTPPEPEEAPDLRSWSARNAKALGVIIGTAMLTVITGTGGVTGLAHFAGIATTKEMTAVKDEIGAVVKAQQTATGTEETRFAEVGTSLTALTKELRALRTDVANLKRNRKPKPTEE